MSYYSPNVTWQNRRLDANPYLTNQVEPPCTCGHSWKSHGKYGTGRCNEDKCDCGSFVKERAVRF